MAAEGGDEEQQNTMAVRVGLVGSSGGGRGALGQQDTLALLHSIGDELIHTGGGKGEKKGPKLKLGPVIFIHCVHALDDATSESPAELWGRRRQAAAGGGSTPGEGDADEEVGFEMLQRGTLGQVNEAAERLDALLAAALESGQVSGLVLVSCDPLATNARSIAAAVQADCPMTGSGGSSLAQVSAMGGRLVGSSGGSVSTTNRSKAVCFANGLAREFGSPYDPLARLRGASPSLTSLLGGVFPAFMAVMLVCTFTDLVTQAASWASRGSLVDDAAGAGGGLQALLWAFLASLLRRLSLPLVHVAAIGVSSLPAVVGAVAAHQSSVLKDSSIVAGVMAGAACTNPASSLLAGVYAGYLLSRCTGMGLRLLRLPATALTITSTGLAGVMAATFGHVISPLVARASSLLLSVLVLTPSSASTAIFSDGEEGEDGNHHDGHANLYERWPYYWPAMAGALLGVGMCYGSKVGLYHRLFFPLILLEMAQGKPSFYGALDLCALCAVGGGICLATWLLPLRQGDQGDASLAKRGAVINLFCGDFVEACLPFMERSIWVNMGGYVGAAASGALTGHYGLRSSAYLPAPIAVLLSPHADKMLLAVVVAFGVPFLCTLLTNGWHRHTQMQRTQTTKQRKQQ